ncbi:MAG: WYL domain-containing protein [Anaerolineae bacterium]|nr:WYL domain-containing protein [Phycisphaerae bacterium]
MPFSLIQPLSELPLAFVDVETTGVSADLGDRVIEVGIARFENGQKVAEYEQLINPQRRISPGITALTGITPAMCENQPTFQEQFDPMMAILRGSVVLGHNVRFDLSFLAREFTRCRCDIEHALEKAPVLDTVRIARRRFGRGGNGLQRLCRRLGYEPPVAHRALADAIATAFVFERLIEPVGHWQMCLCDAMAQQGGPMGLTSGSPKQQLLPLELEEALEQKCPVTMEYLDGNDQRTQRVIQPLSIRRRQGELELIAYCQLRNDRRTFKLERIVQLSRLNEYQPEPQTLFDQTTSGQCSEERNLSS